MISELPSAELAVLRAIQGDSIHKIEGLNPDDVHHLEAREIVRHALSLHEKRGGDATVTVHDVANVLSGGLSRFNRVIADAENRARQSLNVNPVEDPAIPTVRALDVIRSEAENRYRTTQLAKMSKSLRSGDLYTYAEARRDLEEFEEKVGAKKEVFFKAIADLPDEDADMEMLVEGIIPAESLGFIAGPPKQGRKTTLATSLAVAVAGGGRWLDRDVQAGRKVLYLAAEEPESAVKKRTRQITNGLLLPKETEETIRQNILIGCAPRWTLDTAEGQSEIEAGIRQHSPALVILDPLTRLFVGDENDRGAVEPVLSFLKGLVLRYHTSVCIIHHASKGAASGSTPENMLRGSSALRGAHDYLLCSSTTSEGGANRLSFELRYGEPFQLFANFQFPQACNSIEIEIEEPEKQPTKNEGVGLAVRALDLLQVHPEGLTQNEVADSLSISKGVAKKTLLSLKEVGKAETIQKKVTRKNGSKYPTEAWISSCPTWSMDQGSNFEFPY